MTTADQRATERAHIVEFLRLAEMDDLEGVTFDDSPDAVLTIGGRRVGLEHRELEEEVLRANDVNLRDFEDLLLHELERLGVRLFVGIGLSADAPQFRKRRDVEALARRVTAWARDHVSEAPLRPSPAWLHKHGFPELVLLSIEPSDEPEAVVTPAAWGPGATSVLPAIRAKEVKLARYRATVTEAWLLLVTGATWTQMTDIALTTGLEVESLFEAVYLLDLRESRVQCLKPPTSR